VIYLDNSATTPIAPEVREAMLPYLEEEYGNASSVYQLGARARVALEDARGVIAQAIGADARELVFTANGTEANNAAMKGAVMQRHFDGASFKSLRVITSSAEHHAVLHPVEYLAKMGVQVGYAQCDSAGVVSEAAVKQQMKKDVAVVSLMMVNNEVGALSPIGHIGPMIKSVSDKALFHTDAVQALGKMPINVRELGVDMLSLSAHKIHGPKAIGALFIKSGTKLEPLMHGGAQERNRRGGTESVALAVGFAKAVEMSQASMEKTRAHLADLRTYLLSKLSDFPEVILNTEPARSIESIVNFSFIPSVLDKLDGEALLIRFDLENIAISNGSACTSGTVQPSHVLMAMGKGKEVASKSIRVSFSRYTQKSAVDAFVEVLKGIIQVP
jgi:cysteine desulfurase